MTPGRNASPFHSLRLAATMPSTTFKHGFVHWARSDSTRGRRINRSWRYIRGAPYTDIGIQPNRFLMHSVQPTLACAFILASDTNASASASARGTV
jgi:hypothetical protein